VRRETCAEVTESVLAYRARLLSRVAEQMKSSGGLERTAALASLDVANHNDLFLKPQNKKWDQDR